MVYVFVSEASFYFGCYTTFRANLMRKYYGMIRPAPLYTGGRLFTREELSVGIIFADVGLLKNYMLFFRWKSRLHLYIRINFNDFRFNWITKLCSTLFMDFINVPYTCIRRS